MNREQIEQAAMQDSLWFAVRDESKRALYNEAFVKGAEWRINSVWHPYTLAPDKGKLLLVEDIERAYGLTYLTKGTTWDELSATNHYMRWAYVADLQPEIKEDAE